MPPNLRLQSGTGAFKKYQNNECKLSNIWQVSSNHKTLEVVLHKRSPKKIE